MGDNPQDNDPLYQAQLAIRPHSIVIQWKDILAAGVVFLIKWLLEVRCLAANSSDRNLQTSGDRWRSTWN